MMLRNKYTEFIDQCRTKDYTGLLTHDHHITPKSVASKLGWTKEQIDAPSNMINLSVHDHFWAHVYFYEVYKLCGTAPGRILKTLNADRAFTEDEFNEAEKLARKLNKEAHLGKHLSRDTKEKISRANTGKIPSEETRKKISDHHRKHPYKHSEVELLKMHNALVGRKFSAESREKMSKAAKGRIPWNKGKPMSDEQKEKLSIANTGYKFTKEQSKNLSNTKKGQTPWNKGKTESEEHKMKIRLSCLRYHHPDLSDDEIINKFIEVKDNEK